MLLLSEPKAPGGYTFATGNVGTFTDVLDAAWDNGRYAWNANSRWRALEEAYDRRIKGVQEATGQTLDNPLRAVPSADDYREISRRTKASGKAVYLPDYMAEKFQRQLARIAEGAPDKLGVLRPHVPVVADAVDIARGSEEKLNDVLSRTSGLTGTLANLAGGVGAAFEDPATYALAPIGFSGSASKSLLWNALRAAASNAAGQAVVEPFIQQWRAEAGLEAGLVPGLKDIAFAGAVGGGLDFAVRGLVRGGKYVTGANLQAPPEMERGATIEEAIPRLPDDNPIKAAAKGDDAALVMAAQKIEGHLTTAERGALRQLELDTNMKIDAGEDLAAIAQAIRHAEAPDIEPAPVHTPPAKAAAVEIDPADEVAVRLSEGRGTTIETASVFRERPELVGAVPIEGKTRTAGSLARLDEAAFDMVRRGTVKESWGALVGDLVADPAEHAPVLERLAERQPERLADARRIIAEETVKPAKPRAISEALGGGEATPVETTLQHVAHAIQSGTVPAKRAREALKRRMATIADDAGPEPAPRGLDEPAGPEAKAEVEAKLKQVKSRLGKGLDQITKETKGGQAAVDRVAGRGGKPKFSLSPNDAEAMRMAQKMQAAALRDGGEVRGELIVFPDALENPTRSEFRELLRKIKKYRPPDQRFLMRVVVTDIDVRVQDDYVGVHADLAYPRPTQAMGFVRADGTMVLTSDVPTPALKQIVEITGKQPVVMSYNEMFLRDIMFSLSPKAAAALPDIRAKLNEAAALLPKAVRIRLYDTLTFGQLPERIRALAPAGVEEKTIAGLSDAEEMVIHLSLSTGDPLKTLRHEQVHMMRALGLLTDDDYRRLVRHAEKTDARKTFKIDATYGETIKAQYADKAAREAVLVEETVAHLVAERLAGKPIGGGLDKVLKPIRDFLRKVRDVLGLKGLRTVEDVFRTIERGGDAGGSAEDRLRQELTSRYRLRGIKGGSEGNLAGLRDGLRAVERATGLPPEAIGDGLSISIKNNSRDYGGIFFGGLSNRNKIKLSADDVYLDEIFVHEWGHLFDKKAAKSIDPGAMATRDTKRAWRIGLVAAVSAATHYFTAGIFSTMATRWLTAGTAFEAPRVHLPWLSTGVREGFEKVQAVLAEGYRVSLRGRSPAAIALARKASPQEMAALPLYQRAIADDGGVVKYYAKPEEMFARAFAAYVLDKTRPGKAATRTAGVGLLQQLNKAEQAAVFAGFDEIFANMRVDAKSRIMFSLSQDDAEAALGVRLHYADLRDNVAGAARKLSGNVDMQANWIAGMGLEQGDAEEIVKLYTGFLKDFSKIMDASTAKRLAREEVAKLLETEALHRKRVALLQLEATTRVREALSTHKNARGEVDPAQAMIGLLEHYGLEGTPIASSVEGKRKAILGQAHARLEEMIWAFRKTGFTGRRMNVAKMENVVRELFDGGSGDAAAKAFADAWTEVSENLRQRFNRAGGAVGKLEKWGLPQVHDARALRKRGLAQWKADTLALLDPAKMRHPISGQPMTTAQVAESLDVVYRRIVTDGLVDAPAGAGGGRGALHKQHAEHRFLVFKNADAWMKYQKLYGTGGAEGIFAAMMNHVNVMSRDIAAMEVLGPNPGLTLEAMIGFVRKEGANAGAGLPAIFPTKSPVGLPWNPETYAASKIQRARDMWAHMHGSANVPVNGFLANTLSAVRNITFATALGSATLSSVTDLGRQQIHRRFAGVFKTAHTGRDLRGATNPMVVLGDVVQQFKSLNRREAVRAGLILESATHVLHESARYAGSFNGPMWSQVFADRMLTWALLTPWTQANRHVFGLSIMAEVADNVGKRFAELDPGLQRLFGRYGMGAAEWDAIRQFTPSVMGDADTFVRGRQPGADAFPKNPTPSTIRDAGKLMAGSQAGEALDPIRYLKATDIADERLAERYLEMILQETERAVPSGTVANKALWVGQNQPGTMRGELMRSVSMLKSYGTITLMQDWGRMASEIAGGRPLRGARFMAAIAIASTLLGALAMQLKSLSRGEDPRPMNEPQFWGAAMMQGGGMGIYGDYLFGSVNRFGGGFAGSLAGPVTSRASNLWNLTGGNLIQFADDEPTNFGRESVSFARMNLSMPFYLRLAYERVLLDELQKVADPEAYQAFRRKASKLKSQFKTGYWWAPGETGPRRAPDLGNLSP